MTKLKIKKWYIGLLEKDTRNTLESILCFCLNQLSLVYGLCIWIRNYLYTAKLVTIYASPKKIISIGGLSWAGAGKTTLALYLYDKLVAGGAKACIIRRGYGDDENKLIRAHTENAFFAVDRVRLVQGLESDYDIFLLDDGFQYRKLHRDYDIVMMTANEWKREPRLLPASIFREPRSALSRASVLVITYAADDSTRAMIVKAVAQALPGLKVYFARHVFKRFIDLQGKVLQASELKTRKLALLSGIGYPQGFFDTLHSVGVVPARTIIYPDHYELTQAEFDDLQEELTSQGMHTLVITRKDFYHIPKEHHKINIIVMEIVMEINDEAGFLQSITDWGTQHV